MSSYVTTDGREVRTRGQKTRARLLQAGAQVFGTKGFHTARVDDIVRAAKTSHGTFYVYFPSKEALLDELLTQIGHEMAELVADLPDLRANDGEARGRAARLVAAIRRLLRPVRRGPAVVDRDRVGLRQRSRHAGRAQRRQRPARRAGRRARAEARRALLRRGQPTVDPGIAALALMALIERFHYYAATGQLRAEGDEVLDTLTDVVASTLVR